NTLLAYTTDTVSRRLFDLHFKDLRTGNTYPETIANVEGGDLAWAADNKSFFYILQDTVTLLGYQVWKHTLGTDPATDVLMYEEKDNRFTIELKRSKSRKYIEIVSAVNELTTEYLLLEASQPTAAFKVFQPREEGIQYHVEHIGQKYFVLTDWKAPNYRLMETEEGKTSKENWKEVIANNNNAYLTDMAVFQNYLVISEMKNALSQLRVIKLADKSEYYIPFDETAYTANLNINPEFNTDTLRFSYSSLTTPTSLYDLDMNTKERVLKKQVAVLGGFKKEDYQSDRIWATGRDGTKIPVSIVYKKGLTKNGKAPLFLYAYGSYGISMPPSFSSNIL
ncbi:MAG: S9 family peptidase, partial [Chitinophagaceae bacterium]